MELIKVSDEPMTDGLHKYYCPFCQTYLSGPVGKTLKHTCPQVGYALILNGYLWYGIQNYLEDEKKSVKKPFGG